MLRSEVNWLKEASLRCLSVSVMKNCFCSRSGSHPVHQEVTEEFSPDWDWVLVGSEQVIVARLDGRGLGVRGHRCFVSIFTHSSPSFDSVHESEGSGRGFPSTHEILPFVTSQGFAERIWHSGR